MYHYQAQNVTQVLHHNEKVAVECFPFFLAVEVVVVQVVQVQYNYSFLCTIPRYGLIGLGYSAHNATTDSTYFHNPGLFHFSSRSHA